MTSGFAAYIPNQKLVFGNL